MSFWSPLLILGLLVREAFPRGHELAQLAADHLLGHIDLLVELAVVDAELVADQLRRDGGGALLCADDRVLARGDPGVDLEGEDVGACCLITEGISFFLLDGGWESDEIKEKTYPSTRTASGERVSAASFTGGASSGCGFSMCEVRCFS